MDFICRAYRFGEYMEDGSLDYGLHVAREKTFSSDADVPDFSQKAFEGVVKNQMPSLNEACAALYSIVPDKAKSFMTNLYGEICEEKYALIACSFGGWVFFRYTAKGNWPAFAKAERFPFESQLELAEKERYFALWDNVTGWFDPRDEDTLWKGESKARLADLAGK